MAYLLLSSLIGGGILRVAVQLHNRFAMDMRYDGVVEEPSLGTAMGMMLAINLILLIVAALVQVVLQAAGLSYQLTARISAVACMLGLNVIVMTWMVAVSLSAPWLRALVISCVHLGISLVIAGTIIGTFAFVAFYG